VIAYAIIFYKTLSIYLQSKRVNLTLYLSKDVKPPLVSILVVF